MKTAIRWFGLVAVLAMTATPAAAQGDDDFIEEDDSSVDDATEEETFDIIEDDDDDDDDDGDSDDDADGDSDLAVPGTGAARWPSLLVQSGHFRFFGFLQLALNKKIDLGGGGSVFGAFQPTSFAPDGWYGFNDELTLGVVHSENAITGFLGGQGDGLCFTGTPECAQFYQSLGLLGRYALMREGELEVVLDGGLVIRRTDPFQLALKAGVLVRYMLSEQLFLDGGANLSLGITKRTELNASIPNKEHLNIPVAVVYALNDEILLFAQTGFRVVIEDFDTIRIPFGLGVYFWIDENWAAQADFTLPTMISGNQVIPDGFDGRTITLAVIYTH